MDERDEPIRQYFIRQGNWCPKCRRKVNPLLHIAVPWLCLGIEFPPFGGFPEPHKDDL